MERFTSVQGRAIPLLVSDIDTDVITPIKRVMEGGDALTRYAFESLRYKADGSPDPRCPLNQEAYREAPILLAGAMMQRMPRPRTAHTAVSRELPHAKFAPASRMGASR